MNEPSFPTPPRPPSPRSAWAGRLLCLCALLLAGFGLAQAWPQVRTDALVAAVDGAPAVQRAALAVEDARLALQAAGAVVSGSLRSSAGLAWSDAQGLEAELGAITLSTQWRLFAAGPSHDAYLRAQQALTDAQTALDEARREAAWAALTQIWALQRLATQTAIAEARLALTAREEEAVRLQLQAGAVHASALEEAQLASLQAELDLGELRLDLAEAELAFQQAIGLPATALAGIEATDLAVLVELAEAASLPPFLPLEAEELGAAVQASSTVLGAADSLTQAQQGVQEARQASAPSASLSAGFSTAGQSGQLSLSGGWDSSSMQPSLSLSLDPWSAQTARTSAQLSVSLTIPLDPSSGSSLAREALAVTAAEAALLQAEQAATLDLEGRLRALSAGQAGLDLAKARLQLRQTSLASLRTRADHGSVSPIALLGAELDAADAALALLRSIDQLAITQAELELLLQRPPSHPDLAAALAVLDLGALDLGAPPMEAP